MHPAWGGHAHPWNTGESVSPLRCVWQWELLSHAWDSKATMGQPEGATQSDTGHRVSGACEGRPTLGRDPMFPVKM